MAAPADDLTTTILVISLFVALCAALTLVATSLRRPRRVPLLIAGGIIVVCVIALAVLPYDVPVLYGAILALIGTVLGTVGGDPFTRWVLSVADAGRTVDGPRGGILVELMAEGAAPRHEEILRGGLTIGYLERLSVTLSILTGFPAAIAAVVAVKSVGRFTELATPAARERFIVGTLASLLWACTVAAVIRLAIW